MSIFTAVGNFFIKIGAKKAPPPIIVNKPEPTITAVPTPEIVKEKTVEAKIEPVTTPSPSPSPTPPGTETLIQDLKQTLTGIEALHPIHTFMTNVASMPSVHDIESKFLAAADWMKAEPAALITSGEIYAKEVNLWAAAKIKEAQANTEAEGQRLEAALATHKASLQSDIVTIATAASQVGNDFATIFGTMKQHLKL